MKACILWIAILWSRICFGAYVYDELHEKDFRNVVDLVAKYQREEHAKQIAQRKCNTIYQQCVDSIHAYTRACKRRYCFSSQSTTAVLHALSSNLERYPDIVCVASHPRRSLVCIAAHDAHRIRDYAVFNTVLKYDSKMTHRMCALEIGLQVCDLAIVAALDDCLHGANISPSPLIRAAMRLHRAKRSLYAGDSFDASRVFNLILSKNRSFIEQQNALLYAVGVLEPDIVYALMIKGAWFHSASLLEMVDQPHYCVLNYAALRDRRSTIKRLITVYCYQ